jgi:sirohydrochlorin ferrochelatase
MVRRFGAGKFLQMWNALSGKKSRSLRDALFLFDPVAVREVYVVPNFISDGYFTQTVVPREPELNGRTTTEL